MNELNNLFRARKTILEMLSDRGYTIPKEVECRDLQHLRNLYMNGECDIYVDKPEPCYVKFIHQNKLRPNTLKECIQSIQDETLPERGQLIIISRNSPNSTLEKICKESRNTQIFWINRLVINITKHELVPRFRAMKEDEIEHLLKNYHIKSRYQLPTMLKTDPIAQYFGYQVGTVCEVERNSTTAGTHTSYRCVK